MQEENRNVFVKRRKRDLGEEQIKGGGRGVALTVSSLVKAKAKLDLQYHKKGCGVQRVGTLYFSLTNSKRREVPRGMVQW